MDEASANSTNGRQPAAAMPTRALARHPLWLWPLAYAATLVTFLALDAVWISFVAVGMFRSGIGSILRPSPLLSAALAYYVIYTAGLLALAVSPAIAQRSVAKAAIAGAIAGLMAYSTFDLTNLAMIAGWPAGPAALDIAWGTFVSAMASMAGTEAGLALSRWHAASARG